ncbi:uncharacterized protein NEMAJ01_1560 [Nematocida major]|uniref:uncharacterized protein n=1 Tax=Nematocida major TaxID=1912982 RepID=UPI002007813D|nr:uncharacterized protein NEMAJ01_1560 [Nematocida major]KAH9386664.1 hypothetical protein NEMAJ01_1560 [Nematocida major]
MEFNRESEVRELERQFNDSIELCNVSDRGKKKERAFNPFKVKYESRDEQIQNVEQELSRLKEMQSKVLGMQGTLEETMEKELKKSKEKEIKEIKGKYKARLLEMEVLYKEKERELRKEYDKRIEKVIEVLKERAKESIHLKVKEQVESIRRVFEKKVLEAKLRDKAVLDKLSQMYIDLKEKYKKDVQKINAPE